MNTRFALRAAIVGLLFLGPVHAMAQEKTGSKPGFVLQPDTVRIVLMRPTIRVGEQSTGGMFEPNADWTAEAREHIATALKSTQGNLGNIIVEYDEGTSGEGQVATDYANLFGSLADSVIEYQFFPGNRLPTKKRDNQFDWGVGPGLAKLESMNGADYALFINTYDSFASSGRKALKIVGLLAGVSVPTGVHWGHAGLVNLKTGELVWLNADRQMGGDVRTADGAVKRVVQLLEGFPGRTNAAPATGD